MKGGELMNYEPIDLTRLRTGGQASAELGKTRTYIADLWKKYPERFKEGTIAKVGNVIIITDEGVEYVKHSMGKEGVRKNTITNFSDYERVVAHSF